MAMTLRALAAHCGLSTATVSRALAGRAHVLPQTRRRIEEAARRHGYARNELVGALMAQLRGARAQTFIGNLAIIHVPKPGQTEPCKHQRRIIQGAMECAQAFGFQLYVFSLGDSGLRPEAVMRQLRARGVLGLVFLYSQPLPVPLRFAWEDFVAVEIDYGQSAPLLHTVCHDQYVTLVTALGRLRDFGYRRFGLFLEDHKDQRIQFKWSAAFTSFQRRQGGIGEIPPLMVEAMTEQAFAAWFQRHQPDLVLGHLDQCVGWLARLGRSVPGKTGFFSLNYQNGDLECAGIDPRLELQGRVAVETLVAQMQRGERGLPAVPRTVLVPGRLVEGPTVQEQTAAPLRSSGSNQAVSRNGRARASLPSRGSPRTVRPAPQGNIGLRFN